MDFFRLEFWLALFAFACQMGVLFLIRKMIIFAKKYGKPWALAFKIFFVAMFICLLRRAAILAFTCGLDGTLKDTIVWTDRYISNPFLSCLYFTFLVILVRWWRDFFGNISGLLTGREVVVGKREDVATDREVLVTKREDEVKAKE